jgi:hypothetical protein
MKSNTRKQKRGGKRNGSGVNKGVTVARRRVNNLTNTPLTFKTLDTTKINENTVEARGLLPKKFLQKVNRSFYNTHEENLLKERVFTTLILWKSNHRYTTAMVSEFRGKNINLPDNTITLELIVNERKNLKADPSQGTLLREANVIGLLPPDFYTGNSALIKKHKKEGSDPNTEFGDFYFLRKGTGTEALQSIFPILKQQGYDAMVLVPMNSTLESFYGRLGFQSVKGIRNPSFIKTYETLGPEKYVEYKFPPLFLGPTEEGGSGTGRAMYKFL